MDHEIHVLDSGVMDEIGRKKPNAIILFALEDGSPHPGPGADLCEKVPSVGSLLFSFCDKPESTYLTKRYKGVDIIAIRVGRARHACSVCDDSYISRFRVVRSSLPVSGRVLILDSDIIAAEFILELQSAVLNAARVCSVFSTSINRKRVFDSLYGSLIGCVHPGIDGVEEFNQSFYSRLDSVVSRSGRVYLRTNRFVSNLPDECIVSCFSFGRGYNDLSGNVIDDAIPYSSPLTSVTYNAYISECRDYIDSKYEVQFMNSLASMFAVCLGPFCNRVANRVLMHKAYRRTVYEAALMYGFEMILGSPYLGVVDYVD